MKREGERRWGWAEEIKKERGEGRKRGEKGGRHEEERQERETRERQREGERERKAGAWKRATPSGGKPAQDGEQIVRQLVQGSSCNPSHSLFCFII